MGRNVRKGGKREYLDTNRANFEGGIGRGFNKDGKLYKRIEDLNKVQVLLKQAKKDEVAGSDNAATSLKALQEAAEKLELS